MKEVFDRTKPHRPITDLERYKNKTPEERKLGIIRTKENIKGIPVKPELRETLNGILDNALKDLEQKDISGGHRK